MKTHTVYIKVPGESAKSEQRGAETIYRQQVRRAWSGGKWESILERAKWSRKGMEWNGRSLFKLFVVVLKKAISLK